MRGDEQGRQVPGRQESPAPQEALVWRLVRAGPGLQGRARQPGAAAATAEGREALQAEAGQEAVVGVTWGDKKRRRKEAKKATRDAERYSKPGSVSRRQEGLGTCKVCLIRNGHTADCSRNS